MVKNVEKCWWNNDFSPIEDSLLTLTIINEWDAKGEEQATGFLEENADW